jgi:hypothetical protein
VAESDPLWYDRAEPEEEAGFALAAFAFLLVGILDICNFANKILYKE